MFAAYSCWGIGEKKKKSVHLRRLKNRDVVALAQSSGEQLFQSSI